ncbi:MAG: LptF/LptG family permease [Candidatus Omnitrophota bacterium]|nr:LptF/LptG family permease [Candidatus Omnitrophota bacterium]
MRILDKYILKNIAYSYIFIVLIFICLYFVIDLSYTLSDILKTKPPAAIVIEYYLNMLPLIFLTVSPFSLPIGVFYTFGELNRHNEVLSMRASGISIARLSFPIIFFAICISFLSLFIQEKFLLGSQKKIEQIKVHFIKKNFSSSSEETNIAFSSGDMIFFIGKLLPRKKTMQDAMIFQEDQNNDIIKKTICRSITYEQNKWQGNDVIEYKLNAIGNISGTPTYWKKKEIPLEEKPEALLLKKSSFFMLSSNSLKNLRKEIRQLKKVKAYDKLSNLVVDYHRKFVEPLSHFFIIIGILPLALEIKKRRAAFSSLGLGIMADFGYYSLMFFSIALGKGGIILPILSPWLAPLFFITFGVAGLILIK